MTAAPLVITGGSVIARAGVVAPGDVVLGDGRVLAVGPTGTVDRPAGATVVDASGGWVAPGFIDVQINGGHGIDLTTEPDRADELGRFLTRYGVTSFVPTIVTCDPERRRAALESWAGRNPDATTGAAVPLGLHLEGPMLSATRRGAHPAELLQAPDRALVAGWSRGAGVLVATIAPELAGALDVIAELRARGVVVAIGHTDCTAEQFVSGVDAGATYVTHLFNAMRPFAHRDPGPIGATLGGDAVVAGLICDGVHVDPLAVRMAWRALGADRINLVTDAVAVLGSEATGAQLGSVDLSVDGAAVLTGDGVLAGSVLSLDRAVRNLIAFTGCGVPEAVGTVTATPARLLGLTDRGALTPGARADVTLLDAELAVRLTVVGGEVAWRS